MLTNASTEQILSVCPAPKNLPLQLIRTSFEDRLREGYRVEVLTCLKTLVSHKGGKLTGCWLTPSVPGRLPYNQKFGFGVVGRMWNSDVVCKGKSYNSTERQWQVAWGVLPFSIVISLQVGTLIKIVLWQGERGAGWTRGVRSVSVRSGAHSLLSLKSPFLPWYLHL